MGSIASCQKSYRRLSIQTQILFWLALTIVLCVFVFLSFMYIVLQGWYFPDVHLHFKEEIEPYM